MTIQETIGKGVKAKAALRIGSGRGMINAAYPTLTSGQDLTQVGTVSSTDLNGARSVAIAGNYAYVAAYSADALTVVDISTPSSPTQVGTVSSTDLGGAYGVAIAGNYAYVAASNADALTVISDVEHDSDCEEMELGEYNLIPLLSETVVEQIERKNSETLLGKAGIESSDIISEMTSGDLALAGHYEGLDQIFAMTLGFEKEEHGVGSAASPKILNATSDTIDISGQTESNVKINNADFASGDVGKWLWICSGAGQHQVRRISAYTSTTEVDITPDWGTTPTDGATVQWGDEFQHIYECSNKLSQQLWTAADDDCDSFTYNTDGVLTSSDYIIRRATLGVEKGVSTWISRAVMIDKLSFNFTVGEGLKITASVIAYDITRDSMLNESSTDWEWSPSDNMESINKQILFHHGIFRLADYTSGGLEDSDKIKIDEFTLEISNNLKTNQQDTSSGVRNIEPVRNGVRTVTGGFRVSRYEDDTLINDVLNNTTKMADMKLTNTSSMGDNAKALNLYMPVIKLKTSKAATDGRALYQVPIEFECYNGIEDITGFPAATVTDPYSQLYISTINRFPFNCFLNQNKEY